MTPEDPRQNWAAPGGSNDHNDADAGAGASQQEQTPQNQWGQTSQPGWGSAETHTYGTGFDSGYQPMQSLRPGIIPLRALRLSEILDGAFKAIRHNPKVIFGFTLPFAALSAILQGLLMGRMFALMEYDYLATDMDPLDEFGFLFDDAAVIYFVLTIAISVFFVPLTTGLLTIAVSRSTMGKKLTMGETWRMLRGRKVALVTASFLVSIISLIPIGIAFALLPLLAMSGSAAVVLLILPLLFIGLIFTVFFNIKMLFVPQVLVLERQGIGAAFKRAWQLNRGSFWRIFGIYLLASLIASVVSSIVSTPITIIAVPLGLIAEILAVVVIAAASVISLLVIVPYSAAVSALLYIDVRMRREGLDIELARAAGENP